MSLPPSSFNPEHEKVLTSIRPSRIVVPSLIGLSVIFYLIQRQVHLDEIMTIEWPSSSYFWIAVAILVYAARHFLYSYRLKALSEGDFSWSKSIELVCILEFASAVSPTNFGGSAVAFFLLIQEKISAARATSMVLYTIIADTLFFVLSFPIVYWIWGSNMFYPIGSQFEVWDGMGLTLVIVWLVMVVYGVLLGYGLFFRPRHLRRILEWFARRKFLRRSEDRIHKAAADIETSADHIRNMPIVFHGKIILATLVAWILRFFTVSAILLALNPDMPQQLYDHIMLLGRGQALYAVTAYSPTPGGSGVAEIIFGQFYGEYVSPGIAVIAAVIWRVITYYSYLTLGAIIIPNWIVRLIHRRRSSSLNEIV